MDEKRKFKRFPLELQATWVDSSSRATGHCKVTGISRTGIAVQLLTKDRVSPGQALALEIDIPIKIEPVTATMAVKWARDFSGGTGYPFMAGGELARITPEDKESLLDYGFESWKQKEKEQRAC